MLSTSQQKLTHGTPTCFLVDVHEENDDQPLNHPLSMIFHFFFFDQPQSNADLRQFFPRKFAMTCRYQQTISSTIYACLADNVIGERRTRAGATWL
jgi:hypothetical protein